MAVNQDGIVVRLRPSIVGDVLYVRYGDYVVVYQHISTEFNNVDNKQIPRGRVRPVK